MMGAAEIGVPMPYSTPYTTALIALRSLAETSSGGFPIHYEKQNNISAIYTKCPSCNKRVHVAMTGKEISQVHVAAEMSEDTHLNL